jgi:hypothetical protein
MKIREKEGKTKIRGENVFKKSRKKGKTNKNKEKMESGVVNNPLITKRKTFCFGRFTKQNKKDLQVKSPFEEKCIYMVDLSQSMEIYIYIISTPPPLHFPKITFISCAPPLKTQKKNLHIPSLPSNQIAQTLETSKSKLNLA